MDVDWRFKKIVSMKINVCFVLFLSVTFISCKESKVATEIIAQGYYVKELQNKPILFHIIHDTDTIKFFTNTTSLGIKPEMIASMDLIKDKIIDERFIGYQNYGVVSLHIKDEYWEGVVANKEKYVSLELENVLKNDNDTVYFNDKKQTPEFEKNSLIVVDNKMLYKSNCVGFLNTKKNKIISVNEYIKINLAKVKLLAEPQLKMKPHLNPSYRLIYDIDSNKIIWKISAIKSNGKIGLNENGGRSYINQQGKSIVEYLEIDAMNGVVLNSRVDNNVNIRIR